ncbi:MAG TPA: glycosyltransferase [Candidatus Babeliaceae bacterium]|nr:glycosyltransferase [Candidatus Babeliaceae bacterium]
MKKIHSTAKYREDQYKKASSEKNLRMSNLDKTRTRLERELTELKQFLEERETQLKTLTLALHDKEGQISQLNQMTSGSSTQVELLTRAILDKELVIQQLQVSTTQFSHWLLQIYNSFGWKLLKPARIIKNFLGKYRGKFAVDLISLSGLSRECSLTKDSLRFLLVAKRVWQHFEGWYWLDVENYAKERLKIKLCFDTGQGFDTLRVVYFNLSGSARHRIPLFVPSGCLAIRVESQDAPEIFRLGVRGLIKPKGDMRLAEEFCEQAVAYEAWGGRSGNAAALKPLNAIQLNDTKDYCWYSETEDPSFILQDLNLKLHARWYLVELTIRLDSDIGNAKLYFDYGNGFSEENSVPAPFKSGEKTKHICRIAAIPEKIRFDPIEAIGKFSVEHLHFVPITAGFARGHMLEYLYTHNARRKNASVSDIWESLQAHARKTNTDGEEVLYKRYKEALLTQFVNFLDYTSWIKQVETAQYSDSKVEMLQQSLQQRPTISVIMATYNTQEAFLRRAIESVQEQSYPNWELCIADDASPDSQVRRVLDQYAQSDSRIKTIFRHQNGHISAASNSALALATGDFVALMDHDDELSKHALLFMAGAINRSPSVQILYSDEDKINEQGTRSHPHFKPDWNPDLLFSQNYVSHLGVYRRELLNRIDGFRVGVEGSQDHDLLLRCLPYVQAEAILHIPKVLYHWRVIEGSTALSPEEKSYTTQAGIKALQDFFHAQDKTDVKIEAGMLPNTYRVHHPIPDPEPMISLLIPTRDMVSVLRQCIQSILEKTTYRNYEIIIIDNNSVEATTLNYFDWIQSRHQHVRVLPYHHPFNFSAINNYGVKNTNGEIVGLINNDTKVITPEWLSEMVSHALRPEIGCVGAKLYYDDETIQHAGVIVGLGGVAGHSHKYFDRDSPGYFGRLKIVQNLSAVTAACLVVRKSIYEEVGGLEEHNLHVAFNDVDFCLKVREAGYRNLWTPYAELYHLESKSRGIENTPEKQARFNGEMEYMKTKWGKILKQDPSYSRNLTLAREDFSIGVR